MSDLRTMTLLNELGDVEIAWEAENDAAMRDIIAKKMSEGVKFFIIKPLIGNLLTRKARLRTISDLAKNKVTIKDDDIEKLFVADKIAMYRRDSGERYETLGRAKTPEQAAASSTVAVRQFQGG